MCSNETFQYWQETSIFTLNKLDFNLTLFDGIKYIKRMNDITPSHPAPVVQTSDSAIHQIIRYTVDKY